MTDTPGTGTTPEEGIDITRVFEAPRDQVWREWTEPERFAGWFGGRSSEVPPSSVSMEVQPGGTWRATMFSGRDRHESRWAGEYLEVVQPERLVFTITDQPGEDEYEVITVVLTDLGDGRTEMRFKQRGGHLSPEEYKRAGQGWGSFFDAIEARLAGA
jgi:uncharacterized protein YndB with AHSA1/START domain